MKKYLLILMFVCCNAFAETSKIQLCFTPGQDCTSLVVNTIRDAKKSILVQAYSFTSAPIAKALVDAHKRGIKVKVILDKSQKTAKYSSSTMLQNYQIPTWIDYKVAIAHNKVIIIDGKTVITGSFNFTKAAQLRNAENLLVIHDENIAKRYAENWMSRERQSRPLG